MAVLLTALKRQMLNCLTSAAGPLRPRPDVPGRNDAAESPRLESRSLGSSSPLDTDRITDLLSHPSTQEGPGGSFEFLWESHLPKPGIPPFLPSTVLSSKGELSIMRPFLTFGFALVCCWTGASQQTQATVPALSVSPAPHSQTEQTQTPTNDGKVRIYVSDSQSWQITGGWVANERGGFGHTAGGARPQTGRIIKNFNQRCPEYTITDNKDRANYAVILDHEGGKGLLRHRNKIAVYNRDGDVIFSGSTVELGNSVKDACAAIAKIQANPQK